jgi:uncharacterized protein (TIGR03437 family)
MLRKASVCFFLLSAPMAIATAQTFLLGVDYSAAIPTGPVAWAANMSAGTDSKGNLYVLVNGLTDTCQSIGSPQICVLAPESYLVKIGPGGTVLYQAALTTPVNAMAVDSAGGIYFAAANSVQKLSGAGGSVVYQRTIGGASLGISAMALDASGRIYLTGTVDAGDLSPTPDAFEQTASSGANPNGFVVRLNAAGGIDYATYLGSSVNNPYGIAVDSSGSAFVMWTSLSTAFPTTPGAPFTSGLSYLVRLTPDGSGLIYSTFTGAGTASLLASDSTGHTVVASEQFYGGGLPVTRFNPQGTEVTFSRTVAGEGVGGLGVDASGNTYLFDSVLPSTANYRARNSLSSCSAGSQDALTVFDGNGTILQSTYLQGPSSPLGLFVHPDSTVDLFSGSLYVTHLAQNPAAQTVQLACIGNAASYDDTAISPGEIVSLFGSGLGPAAGTPAWLDAAGRFPTEVANVKVTFNGEPSPLLYVQDGQINAIAPWSLQDGQQVAVCVVYNGATTNCLNAGVAAAHPGVFMVDPHHALALNQDGTVNSASNPAKIGSVVSIFGTGLGAIEPVPSDGSIVGLPCR